jgi:hypothetical protein
MFPIVNFDSSKWGCATRKAHKYSNPWRDSNPLQHRSFGLTQQYVTGKHQQALAMVKELAGRSLVRQWFNKLPATRKSSTCRLVYLATRPGLKQVLLHITTQQTEINNYARPGVTQQGRVSNSAGILFFC